MSDIADPTAIAVQVALTLRAGIYSGEYPAGSELPGRRALAEKYSQQIGRRLSEATMNRALVLLARERLISMGSGRRTTVAALTMYQVFIEIGGPREIEDWTPYRAALAAAADVECAIDDGSAVVQADKGEWCWSMYVRSANGALACVIGLGVASRSVPAGPDQWDFSRASVTAEPR